MRRWWRFRDVHRAFGLKFWALISGGGALPGPLENFWNAVGLVLVQGYGMTETTAIITLNHPFHVAEGTLGKPLPGREVKLGSDGEVLVRGAAVSHATWSGGALHPRTTSGWRRATWRGAHRAASCGFLGRKSEVIVTAAGVNLHPEDLEAAIEQEPAWRVARWCRWRPSSGPEPCAVLAMRGQGGEAAAVIERANRGWRSFSGCGGGCCGRSPTCRGPRRARSGARRWPRGWQEFRPRHESLVPANGNGRHSRQRDAFRGLVGLAAGADRADYRRDAGRAWG